MEDEKSTHLKDKSGSSKIEEQMDEPEDDFIIGEESEPYLGMSWPVLMLVLWALKTLFPAKEYSLLWWFQMYILLIVSGVTVFTLLKRYKYSKQQHIEKQYPVKDLPEGD